MINSRNIHYKKDTEFSKEDFFTMYDYLFNISQKEWETLVKRPHKELEQYYGHTLFMFLNEQLIGKSCIHPTDKMENQVKISDRLYNIWETTWTLIIPEYRNQWLGNELGKKSLKIIWEKYDMIIWGTINNIMKNIRLKEWFEITEFPPKLFNEGKEYFKDKLHWWEQEFIEKATCIVKFKEDIDAKIKSELLHLFHNYDEQAIYEINKWNI